MKLTTDKDLVLAAAAESGEAERVLRLLFPEAFGRGGYPLGSIFAGPAISTDLAGELPDVNLYTIVLPSGNQTNIHLVNLNRGRTVAILDAKELSDSTRSHICIADFKTLVGKLRFKAERFKLITKFYHD